MSVRIATSLTMDQSGFDAGITRSEAKANALSARLRGMGIGLFGGKSAKESADTFGVVLAAQEKLESVRKQNAFARMTDEQKVSTLETEIAETKTKVAGIEGITSEKIALQLQIEEKSLAVDRIRAQLAVQRQAAASAAAVSAAREAEAARLARIADLGSLSARRRAARESEAGRVSRIAELQQLAATRRAAREAAAATELEAAAAARRARERRALLTSESAGVGGGRGTADIERVLRRRFGLGDAMKALLAGVGFASIDKIGDMLTSGFRRAAEAAKDIAEQTERAMNATMKLIDLRRTDQQRLAAARREGLRLGRERASAMNQANFFAGTKTEQEAAIGRAHKAAADMQENALLQGELQKKIDDDKKRRTEDIAEQRKRLEEATFNSVNETKTLEEKYGALQLKAATLGLESLKVKDDELAHLRLLTEEEEARGEAARVWHDIQKRNTDELKKQERDEERKQKERDRKEKSLREAEKDYAKAQREFAREKHDRLAFTVEEAATGSRGRSADKFGARQILRDEATARGLLDSGRTLALFDAKTQRNFEAGSEFFQDRALAMRKKMGGLTSDEQDPMRAAGERLNEAADKLGDAAESLKNVEVEVDVG